MLLLIFSACHQAPATTSTPTTTTDTDTKKSYFPVADFLAGEIATVDSTPYKMVMYRTINGKKDSALITVKEFNQLASAFLSPDLDSNRFAGRFRENSFLDQTTNLLMFTYTVNDTLLGLRRVDVVADPGPPADKVRSIYMETRSGNYDSTIIRKMYWRSGKNFSIYEIDPPRQGQTRALETKVVWDSSE